MQASSTTHHERPRHKKSAAKAKRGAATAKSRAAKVKKTGLGSSSKVSARKKSSLADSLEAEIISDQTFLQSDSDFATSNAPIAARLDEMLEWCSHLNVKTLKDLTNFYSRDVFFKDPFVEVSTAVDLEKYYLRILDKVSNVQFVFENKIREGHQAFVTWIMTASFMGREFTVRGTSHLKFDADGLCEYHRDYFDPSEEVYEQIPLIGAVFRGLKRVFN